MNTKELKEFLTQTEPTPGFTRGIIQQVWRVVDHLQDEAIHRESVQWITVDWLETLDADDAIWCECLNKKAELRKRRYRVYISITDISEAIKVYSPADMEAMIRATSIYLSPGVIPRFHEKLSNDVFSLNGKRKHITLTTQFDIDGWWLITNVRTYESLLNHQGKYTHDEFSEESQNPDSKDSWLIWDLFEVARRLNLRRGVNLWERSMDEATWVHHSSGNMSPGLRKVHKMIEVFMVTANQIVAWDISKSEHYGIFRQHHNLTERAFYTQNSGRHVWLNIHANSWWYTHFTSPLRRFADLMVHRMVKARLRWEPLPYSYQDVRIILEYVNRRVFEIDVLQDIRRKEYHGAALVQRIHDRKGVEACVHDLKQSVRRMVEQKGYVLPQAIRKRILADLEDRSSKTWQWAVGIFLLWNDYEIKEALRVQILESKRMRPSAFLNAIAQTRLILWERPIFHLDEDINANSYTIKITLPDGEILKNSGIIHDKSKFTIMRWWVRRGLVEQLFWYYMKK